MTEYFKTKDLWLAAYLRTIDIDLIDLEWEGSNGYFVFEDSARKHMIDYENGKGLVEAIKLRNCLANLRSMLKNAK